MVICQNFLSIKLATKIRCIEILIDKNFQRVFSDLWYYVHPIYIKRYTAQNTKNWLASINMTYILLAARMEGFHWLVLGRNSVYSDYTSDSILQQAIPHIHSDPSSEADNNWLLPGLRQTA